MVGRPHGGRGSGVLVCEQGPNPLLLCQGCLHGAEGRCSLVRPKIGRGAAPWEGCLQWPRPACSFALFFYELGPLGQCQPICEHCARQPGLGSLDPRTLAGWGQQHSCIF